MRATSNAVASAIRPAQCAFIFMPPSSTKSTTSGSTAKIEVSPSDPLTGSYTCWYMMPPSPRDLIPGAEGAQTRGRHVARHAAPAVLRVSSAHVHSRPEPLVLGGVLLVGVALAQHHEPGRAHAGQEDRSADDAESHA